MSIPVAVMTAGRTVDDFPGARLRLLWRYGKPMIRCFERLGGFVRHY
jgi:hypothetical protein